MSATHGYSSTLKHASPSPALEEAQRTCRMIDKRISHGAADPTVIADTLAQAAITLREASK